MGVDASGALENRSPCIASTAWREGGAGTSLADLPGKLHTLDEELAAAGRRRDDLVVSAFPTDRFTVDVVRAFAAHGVDHVMVPAFSFEADKVKQRLEQVAAQVIAPYRHGA